MGDRKSSDVELPGQVELDAMCSSAARVNELCQLINRVFRPESADVPDPVFEPIVRDGAWILPEEV